MSCAVDGSWRTTTFVEPGMWGEASRVGLIKGRRHAYEQNDPLKSSASLTRDTRRKVVRLLRIEVTFVLRLIL